MARGSKKKLQWADKHFETLHSEIARVREENPYRVTHEPTTDPLGYKFYIYDLAPPDPDLGLIIGDCIHNLRALWFKELEELDSAASVSEDDDRLCLSDRVNHLFEVVKNERTGKPYTNSEVARASLGDLTEQEVEGIRTGKILDPRLGQVVALADVFCVRPSYFIDRGKKPPVIDERAMEALSDENVSSIAHKSLDLSDRDKQMILGIIQQLGDMNENELDDREATP